MEKVGRNDPCPCGSGLKYKKCCYGKPPKPKFKASVIKSGKTESKVPDLMTRFQTEAAEKKEFTMTNQDYKASNGQVKIPVTEIPNS